MQKWFRRSALALVVLASGALWATAAEAHTCASACSQIRRACVHVSKADRKAGRIECAEAAEACGAACEAAAASCPGDCDAAAGACLAACAGDALCEEDCAVARAQCNEDCENCGALCDAEAATCHVAVGEAAAQAKADCEAARAGCDDICVDPIDGSCVNGCKADQHGCGGEAKRVERACKNACAGGPGRRACMRACRKATEAAFELCSQEETICIGGCIGLP